MHEHEVPPGFTPVQLALRIPNELTETDDQRRSLEIALAEACVAVVDEFLAEHEENSALGA